MEYKSVYDGSYGILNPHNKVCMFIKSLYGIKHAFREWFYKLLAKLVLQDFVQSKNDCSLFIKRKDSHICIAAVYVDEIILWALTLFK